MGAKHIRARLSPFYRAVPVDAHILFRERLIPCEAIVCMRELTPLEKIIYNNGERLIFGVSHCVEEDIRHRSSYIFFRKVIKNDIKMSFFTGMNITIADLGCGVGHGCEVLAQIQNAAVIGVDICQEAIEYAKIHYNYQNVTYLCGDLHEYIQKMPVFDYAVARGVFEHIPDGITLAFNSKWSRRLIFDVPYNEPSGANPHHVLSNITEKDFNLPDVELFYQDLEGVIYDCRRKPPKPNMIICIRSRPPLRPVAESGIGFPVPAWRP